MKKILKIIVLALFFTPFAFALSPANEKKMYMSCYMDSKKYIGQEKAKEYCLCTIQMLSHKYSDKEIEEIFTKKPEKIIKATEFATNHCESNKKAIN